MFIQVLKEDLIPRCGWQELEIDRQLHASLASLMAFNDAERSLVRSTSALSSHSTELVDLLLHVLESTTSIVAPLLVGRGDTCRPESRCVFEHCREPERDGPRGDARRWHS